MDTCLLCLKAPSTFNSYIPINSQKWWQADVLGVIEKHFWPMDDITNTLGICFLCWSKLNDFHIFYQNIEEAQRKIANISKEKKFTNSCIKSDLFEAPQVCKSNFISNEETEFAAEEFTDINIKIEESFNDYEHILTEFSTRTNNQKTFSPMCIEKRKRGRPRKDQDIRKMIVNKPKGKRGRPRKDSKIGIHNTTLSKRDNVQLFSCKKDLENSSPRCAFITTTGNSPAKKRGRGRPRKIENINENYNKTHEIIELPVSGNDISSSKECSEGEKLISDKCTNLKETEKITNKRKVLFSSLMKRRKPAQQHKALMRKYIATSVRCMKIFKK